MQLLRRLYRYYVTRRDDPDGEDDTGDVAAVLARLAMAMPVVPTAASSAVAAADALLAPLGLRGFLADHWERRPVHLPAPQSHRCAGKGDGGSGGTGGGGASQGGAEGGDGEGKGRFEALRVGVLGSEEAVGAPTMIRRLTTLPPAAADQLDPVAALAELASDPHAHLGGGARHLVDVRLVRCCASVTPSQEAAATTGSDGATHAGAADESRSTTSDSGERGDGAAELREECWHGGGGGGEGGGGGDGDGRWLVNEAAVAAAAAEGYSVTLRAATLRGSAAAAATAAALATALGLSVSGNIYVTPGGARGLQVSESEGVGSFRQAT